MTECEVVNALGPTSLIDIGSNEQGERAVVLTYSEGAHAGIYRFTSGLLSSVEALPEKPKAQRPQRRSRPAAKPKPKPKTQPAARPQPTARSQPAPPPPPPPAAAPPAASPWPQPATQPQPAPWPQPATEPQPAPWPQPAQ